MGRIAQEEGGLTVDELVFGSGDVGNFNIVGRGRKFFVLSLSEDLCSQDHDELDVLGARGGKTRERSDVHREQSNEL